MACPSAIPVFNKQKRIKTVKPGHRNDFHELFNFLRPEKYFHVQMMEGLLQLLKMRLSNKFADKRQSEYIVLNQ
jgi:hypothetical protein